MHLHLCLPLKCHNIFNDLIWRQTFPLQFQTCSVAPQTITLEQSCSRGRCLQTATYLCTCAHFSLLLSVRGLSTVCNSSSRVNCSMASMVHGGCMLHCRKQRQQLTVPSSEQAKTAFPPVVQSVPGPHKVVVSWCPTVILNSNYSSNYGQVFRSIVPAQAQIVVAHRRSTEDTAATCPL